MNVQEENNLIDRILAGEQECYTTLVDHYKSYAFTIALKVVQNRPEAEEAAQDGFVKAFRNLKSFNRQARFSTWLYRIVFNTAISYKRKSRPVFQSIEHSILEHPLGADTDLIKQDRSAFLNQGLELLNETDRLAIQLYYISEFSLEEVADIMAQNVNTIKVRVHRARLRLADELRKILKQEVLTL